MLIPQAVRNKSPPQHFTTWNISKTPNGPTSSDNYPLTSLMNLGFIFDESNELIMFNPKDLGNKPFQAIK
ncbi:MAG: hypothetical protein EZS28_039187 [Streblomastix strix]|uniref:Uncharacterized protein n=1 Tax=Streblomastix strix TaxID=222440 RepID=A0A5J4U3V8_9EUKA|nr:MAG: hypothetical protein EZS28_039187 [Streblomastix strix]